MMIRAQSNNPNVNQGDSPIALDDLLKYPELAQRIASVNQVALGYLQNALVQATMEEQKASIQGATSSGFGSAIATTAIGAVEGVGGGINGAGGVYGIKAAVETTGEINKVTETATQALEEFRSTNTKQNIQLLGDDETAGVTPPGASGTVHAANETTAAAAPKPDSVKTISEIVSEKDAKIEELKSKTNETSSKATLFQNAAQAGQFFSQAAQASSKTWDVNQQMLNSSSGTAQSTTQSANQIVQMIAGIDFQRQNVRG